MHIGAMRVRLLLRQSRTLKDKRQVVRSILAKLRDGFHVAATEVDAQEEHQTAILGIAAVGEGAKDVKSTLEAVANALRGHPVAEFVFSETSVDAPIF